MPSFEIKETENFYEGSALKEQHKVGGLQLTALGNIESNNVISKLTRSKLHTSAIDFQQADKNYVTPDSEARYSIPLTFGIGVRIPFAKRWSIASGLDCSILTTRYDKANHYINGSITEYTNVTNRIIYLGIPLNVYFDIISNHRVSFYVYAGGTIEKGISNRYTAPAGLNHTEKIAGVQMSVQAGLGVEFKIVGPMNFFIDPAVKYFFTNETQPVSIRSRQPFSMGFDAGLRFTL